MRWLNDIIDSMDMSWSKLQEILKDREAWHAAVHGVAKTEQLYTAEQPDTSQQLNNNEQHHHDQVAFIPGLQG